MGAASPDVLQLGDGLRVRSSTMFVSGVLPDRIFMVKANAAAGAFTITLPPAASVPGQLFVVKKIDSTGNIVTISPAGADTIDGAAFQKLTSQYEPLTFFSDGSTWLTWTPIASGDFNSILVNQPADVSGTPVPAVTVNGGAHSFVLNTEQNDININLARTVTFVGGGGAIATQRAILIQAPTYSSSLAQTITTAATVAITGAPVAAGGMTITNPAALWVQSGNVQYGTVGSGVLWDNTLLISRWGTSTNPQYTNQGTSQICVGATTLHNAANTFAEFGEGRALGPPTGTCTAILNGAGGLTGVYSYAYCEYDVDGNNTTLGPISLTISPAAQQIQVTVPRGRTGAAGRKLFRTKANGSTYWLVNDFGSGYGYNQTIFNDNVADTSLVTGSSSIDFSQLYKVSIRRGETFFCAHPDQAGTTHDLGLLTGNPGTPNEWALDAYGTITARCSQGDTLYAIHTGNTGTSVRCDYNTDVVGSAIVTPFQIQARGECVWAPVAYTSGAPSLFTWTQPAHTGLTASTEAISIYYDLGTNTTTWATGALTTQRFFVLNNPIIAFAGASTVTNCSTLAVLGPPSVGANATLTNSYGITVGLMQSTTLTGAKALGLFTPGACFGIARNTTNNIECFWGTDTTDVYFGARTNHHVRFNTNGANIRMTVEAAGRVTVGATLNLAGTLGRAFNIEATNAGWALYDGTQAADAKVWDHFILGNTLVHRTMNDALGAAANWMVVTRAGNTITSVSFPNGSLLTSAGVSLGFFGVAAAAQQTSGANLTNNVTSGGVNDTIANYTDLTTYANDAAAIRNDIYQLSRKLKQVNDAMRLYGLLT